MEEATPAQRRYRTRGKTKAGKAVGTAKLAVIYLRVSTEKQVKREIDPQGLSVPDQRNACVRRVSELHATVEHEGMELAETAKVLDRPELQRLLHDEELLARIDYFVVFNLSRLARNVGDQIEVMRFLRSRGVELVSATEHIDETPAGKFMLNVMGAMNQYHSDNSAFGAIRGMTQKAKVGGTPGRAPIGYRNITRDIDGRLVKLVEVDEERATAVRWVYEMYATGEWTIRNLTDELERRGVTCLPVGKRPAAPIHYSKVAFMLSNRYYIGIVTFRGVEYAGRHEPLIEKELYDKVQAVLATRQGSGEKRRVHHHYLKSSIYCLGCGSRLCITKAKGRYLYFFCVGRQKKRGCQQPYLRVDAVEAVIENHYKFVSLEPALAEQARQALASELAEQHHQSQRVAKRQEKRLARLDDERRKLLQAHYADAVPLDLLKEEQDRISRETRDAERLLQQAQTASVDVEHTITEALELATNLYEAYRQGDPQVRRLLNQFFFEKVLVGREEIQVEFSRPAKALYRYALGQVSDTPEQQRAQYLRRCAPTLFAPALSRRSSNMNLVAPPTGFEPVPPP